MRVANTGFPDSQVKRYINCFDKDPILELTLEEEDCPESPSFGIDVMRDGLGFCVMSETIGPYFAVQWDELETIFTAAKLLSYLARYQGEDFPKELEELKELGKEIRR